MDKEWGKDGHPKENQSAFTRKENECFADKKQQLSITPPGQLQYIVSLLVFVHF